MREDPAPAKVWFEGPPELTKKGSHNDTQFTKKKINPPPSQKVSLSGSLELLLP